MWHISITELDETRHHRRNLKKPKTKVERTFAWLGNYRHLLMRWKSDVVVYHGFFHLTCALSALNQS